jgi:vacuolar-type H+-ATPase subunit E/Vma4
LDLEQLKNPLVATALGITLALLLLSLSHLPKMVSHMFGHKEDHSVARSWDSYDRAYGRGHLDRQDSMYQNARDSVNYAKDRAEDIYYHAKDAVTPRESLLHRARNAVMGGRRIPEEEHHESLLQRARDYLPGRHAHEDVRRYTPEEHESILQRARDYLPGRHRHEDASLLDRARDAVRGGSGDSYRNTGSYVDSAQRAACRTAERARDIACDFSGSSSWSPNIVERGREAIDNARYQARDAMDNARYQARDAVNSARYNARDTQDTVADRAQSIYEQAKARAADMLESAKDTVTYPVRAAQDTVERVRETARDTVIETQERARGSAGSTIQAAKDSVYNAKEAVKDTVLGAGETVKNVAGGVKDTVVGAGQAVKDRLTPSQDSADINVDAHGNGRGPTKIKVEVQEL